MDAWVVFTNTQPNAPVTASRQGLGNRRVLESREGMPKV